MNETPGAEIRENFWKSNRPTLAGLAPFGRMSSGLWNGQLGLFWKSKLKMEEWRHDVTITFALVTTACVHAKYLWVYNACRQAQLCWVCAVQGLPAVLVAEKCQTLFKERKNFWFCYINLSRLKKGQLLYKFSKYRGQPINKRPTLVFLASKKPYLATLHCACELTSLPYVEICCWIWKNYDKWPIINIYRSFTCVCKLFDDKFNCNQIPFNPLVPKREKNKWLIFQWQLNLVILWI